MAIPSSSGYNITISGDRNASKLIFGSDNSTVNDNGSNSMDMKDLENRTTALENALENRVEYEHTFKQRIDNAQGI